MSSLLKSRKFYLALFGIIQTLLFWALPDFPDEIWQSIDALVMVLIGAIALEDAGAKMAGNGGKK